MSVEVSFKGAVSEVITPFHADGTLNRKQLESWVNYQIEAGIAGLFTNGLASEGVSLTNEERAEVNAIVCKQAAGRVPVMANIIGNTPAECLHLLKAYEQAGANAISLTQPMTYAFTQDGLYEHLAMLATATKLPVCIYNAPQTGNVLAPVTVAKLFHQCDNVMYYKESTIDIVHIQNTMRLIGDSKKYEFLAGSDASTLPIVLLGGQGIVSLISSVFPKPIIKLCDEIAKGDLAAAVKTQFEVLQIRDALKTGPFMAGYKYACELVGVPVGVVRKPLSNLTEDEKTKIKTNLAKLDLVS